MQTRIETLTEKKLIGIRIRMSFSDNQTAALWRSFLPLRKGIKDLAGPELYSVEIYPAGFFNQFNPQTPFEKWAAVEVKDYVTVPDGMETLVLPGGLYAVVLHQGAASALMLTYRDILQNWLPNSGFILDHRPHFAVMGEKYKNENPDSEEDICLPIKPVK